MRPLYFFPGKDKAEIIAADSATSLPFGQSAITAGPSSAKIGDVGQASAALRGLKVDEDVWCIEISTSAAATKGPGVLVEFIPNPYPNGHVTGWRDGITWVEFNAGPLGMAFIGWPTDSAIGPDSIARHESKQIDGEMLADPHGESWLIPIARATGNEFGALPTRWVATTSGLAKKPREDAVALWEFAGEVWDFYRAVNTQVMDRTPLEKKWGDPYAVEAAIRVLGVNYYFGQAEMMLLEAFKKNPITSDFALEVLHSLIDYQAFRELVEQKKTRQAAMKTATATNPAQPSPPAQSSLPLGAPA